MKTTLLAAAALLAFAAAPAAAQEGNGNLFPYAVPGVTTVAQAQVAAVSSEAYPDAAGRPGSNLAQLSDELLPGTASEALVQTASSLPRGAEVGSAAFATADAAALRR